MPTETPRSPLLRHGLLLLILLMVLSMAWRIAAPSDIDDNEQPITIAQFFDVAIQGHWLIQFNPFEGLSTKPPGYHWIGGLILLITGLTSEWGLKLASVIPWAATTMLVVAVAKATLPWRMAMLAGGIWVANFHTIKLGYTARPDMALTLFMTLALLGVLLQKPSDALEGDRDDRRRYWICWGVIWLATLLAGLMKGPPALFVSVLIPLLFIHQRQWRRCDAATWSAGLVLSVGLMALWLYMTVVNYPQWHEVLDDELWDRFTGEETGVKNYPPRWREITYFLGRFFPWSILAVTAMILLPWWRRPASDASRAESGRSMQAMTVEVLARKVTWAAMWVLVVLVLLAIPKGRRADHILPVYAGASVLAVALVELAHRRHPIARVMTSVMVGGVIVAALGFVVAAMYWLPWPGQVVWEVAEIEVVELPLYTRPILWSAAGVTVVSALTGAWSLKRRWFYPAAWSAVFAMASIVGIYNAISSKAALKLQGQQVKAFALTAQNQCRIQGRAPLFFFTGYVPVQSLMGYHQPMLRYQPPAGPVLVITSDEGWKMLTQSGARGRILLQTPVLEESRKALMLVRPEYLPEKIEKELDAAEK